MSVDLLFAGVLTLTSLCFLAASIYPQSFDYIAREPSLLAYAQQLIRNEEGQANDQPDLVSAIVTLKIELARQYAKGADHNRQINKRREWRRSVAGSMAPGSVLTTVFLVGTPYLHYVFTRIEGNMNHAATQASSAGAPAGEPRENGK